MEKVLLSHAARCDGQNGRDTVPRGPGSQRSVESLRPGAATRLSGCHCDRATAVRTARGGEHEQSIGIGTGEVCARRRVQKCDKPGAGAGGSGLHGLSGRSCGAAACPGVKLVAKEVSSS